MRYKTNILIILLINFTFTTSVVQGALPDWNRPLGGRGDDFPVSMQRTSDRGYIIAGTTTSYGAGDSDIWLIKTDDKGNNLLWDKPLGGKGNDSAGSVIQIPDNRYIIAGTTTSYSTGGSDIWFIKIDTNGNRLWDKPFGGKGNETAASVAKTSDGGYIIAGTTTSYSAGGTDIWLIKTDANGNRLWDRPFGGAGEDTAASVAVTSDGGYIIAGTTTSYSAGGSDIWFIKTDAKGNLLWDKPFGGKGNESAASMERTSDAGYIIAGTTTSYSAGGSDIWLIKTDSNGSRLWDKPFGGAGEDTAASIAETSDGGYIIAGTTTSYSAGGSDIWLIKTDSNGNRLWDKPFGGTEDDTAASVAETSDGGYIIAGTTTSYNAGGSDVWILYVQDELSSTRKSSKVPLSTQISNIYRQYVSVILAVLILAATIYIIIKLKK